MLDNPMDEQNTRLNQYRAQLTNGLWHTVPDDGYIYDHLFALFAQTGQLDEMHAVLREETIDHRNGWSVACERVGRPDGYRQDVTMAWSHAEEQTQQFLDRKQGASAFGLEIRYALIAATMTSLATNVPPELIAALVENGQWTFPHARSHAYRMDGQERVDAFLALMPFASDNERRELLEAAVASGQHVRHHSWAEKARQNVVRHLAQIQSYQTIVDIVDQAESDTRKPDTLAYVVDQLVLLGRWPDAVEVANTIPDEYTKSNALKKLVKQLTGDGQHAFALEVAQSIQGDSGKDQALRTISEHFANDGQSQRALDIAKMIEDDDRRGYVLVHIAERLAQNGQHVSALEIVNALDDAPLMAEALARVAMHLNEPQKQAVFDSVLEKAANLDDEDMAEWIVTLVVKGLAHGEQYEAAFKLGDRFESESWKNSARESLALQIGLDGHYDALFKMAPQLTDNFRQARVAGRIAQFLANGHQYERALEILRGIGNAAMEINTLAERLAEHTATAKALTYITLKLVQDGQGAFAVEVANTIGKDNERNKALFQVASALVDNKNLDLALNIAQSMTEEYFQSQALVLIAQKFSDAGQFHKALEVAAAISRDGFQNGPLSQIAVQLAQSGEHQMALEIANTLAYTDCKVLALTQIATYLPTSQKQAVLLHALHNTRYLQDNRGLDWSIRSVEKPYFPPVVEDDYATWRLRLRDLPSESRCTYGTIHYHPMPWFADAIAMAEHLGGQADVDEAMTALHDVFRWWP